MKRALLVYTFFICTYVGYSQNFSGGFSFTLPPFDSTTQAFLPTFPSQPIENFIDWTSEGHFTSEGNPIRFWGVNVTSGACFPPKDLASRIAARMRKMGINLVRFHHLDNNWSSNQGSIFNQNGITTELNPITLDRLFNFLATMKNEGIYANMNLHVSRTFSEQDGVLNADSIPDFGKAVTMFDRQLIQLQKDYARQLLTTPNPYTGLAMVDDPVVAMVEITNENSIYGYWKSNWLMPFSEGGNILSRHADTLDGLWTQFLREKYTNQDALANSWGGVDGNESENLLQNGGFEAGQIAPNWRLELHETSDATVQIVTENPIEGNYCAKFDVNKVTGTAWHIQFLQGGASIEKDSTYLIRFYGRSNGNRKLSIGTMRNAAPWTWYGGTEFNLTETWKEYQFSFRAPENNNNLTRVTLQFGGEEGQFWIDDVRLSSGKTTGLLENESLDNGNVRRISYAERFNFHPNRTADMAAFYLKLQSDYYQEMYDFLKGELGVKVPITGSNALGGIYETYTHEVLDYIDDHAYWDHPQFPSVPWSSTDWRINNTSMLANDNLGTISGIFGGYQRQGKPFTISEYNHAQPNIYQTEMMPLLASYGSLHGADGFMFFDYNSGDYQDWQRDFQDGYFELHRNTPIMALSPLFAYAYRHHYIQEDTNPALIRYSENFLTNTLPQVDNNGRWGKYFPYASVLALNKSIQTSTFSAQTNNWPDLVVISDQMVSSTQELTYFAPQELFQLVTPKIEAFTGQLPNANQINGGNLKLINGDKHGTIVWLSLTEDPLELTTKSIITIASRFQNQGMNWISSNTLGNQWGDSPTRVQPLNLTVKLDIRADSLRVYPLSVIGSPMEGFTVLPDQGGGFTVNFDQSVLQSLWFGVEAFNTTTSIAQVAVQKVNLYPNPVASGSLVTISGLTTPTPFKIINPQGQIVQEGQTNHHININRLPAGTYIITLQNEHLNFIKKMIIK